jgi:hypothetical protein
MRKLLALQFSKTRLEIKGPELPVALVKQTERKSSEKCYPPRILAPRVGRRGYFDSPEESEYRVNKRYYKFVYGVKSPERGGKGSSERPDLLSEGGGKEKKGPQQVRSRFH